MSAPRRSLRWDDDALLTAAETGPEDADAAVASWERYAPREAVELPEAGEDDRTAAAIVAGIIALYLYDPARHQYRNVRTGRVVPPATLHGWTLTYSERVGKQMRTLTQQLRDGSITLREWQLRMAAEIKAAHVATSLAASGGRLQMTQGDWRALTERVVAELRYLSAFADGIADGSVRMDGRIVARSEQYGLASRGTFAAFQRRAMIRRGFDEERNVRGKRDSCRGCLDETARGWVSVGELSLPGSRTCLSRCGCRIEYRNSITGATYGD